MSHDINHGLNKVWMDALPKKTDRAILSSNSTTIAEMLISIDFAIKAHIHERPMVTRAFRAVFDRVANLVKSATEVATTAKAQEVSLCFLKLTPADASCLFMFNGYL